MIEKLYLPTDAVVKIVFIGLYFEVTPKIKQKLLGFTSTLTYQTWQAAFFHNVILALNHMCCNIIRNYCFNINSSNLSITLLSNSLFD